MDSREMISRRAALEFQDGELVNLGFGMPMGVVNFIPKDRDVILQSENGCVLFGPTPKLGKQDSDTANAGSMPITLKPGAAVFDLFTSFGIIRGGHVDYTVLGVLEVDQEGNLANYKVPGRMVPGMGGAMDLTTGARTVIAATLHFEPSGASRLRRRCTLPLTAAREVDLVVTDLGLFEVAGGRFILKECLGPQGPDWILAHTDADIEVARELRT